MNKLIPSFKKNHNTLKCGLHFCNTTHEITTWDLRFKKPNNEENDYLEPKAMHTIEHLVATTLRNSDKSDNITYFGPMGCCTGFYLLTYGLSRTGVEELLIKCLKEALELKEIPGNLSEQCGNYKFHDLWQAQVEIRRFIKVLEEQK